MMPVDLLCNILSRCVDFVRTVLLLLLLLLHFILLLQVDVGRLHSDDGFV